MSVSNPCPYCGHGRGAQAGDDPSWGDPTSCRTGECPGNKETKLEEDPQLLKAIRDALVAYAFTQHGMPAPEPLPIGGAEKIYNSDVWRWLRVGLRACRKFESEERDRVFEAIANAPAHHRER